MKPPEPHYDENTERKHIKAFYQWMVEIIGSESWSKRRESLKDKIRKSEEIINLKKPIEPQLYTPPENDIDWYIFVSELAWDHQFSDSAYSSRRIYPYALAIGAYAEELRRVPNIDSVLSKMLANKSSPENQLFEILTAAHYLKNKYSVEFISENSFTRPDGCKKSPDLKVSKGVDFLVECKRAAKQTRYSQDEERAWKDLWESLSSYMIKSAPWTIAEIQFHSPIHEVKADDLIAIFDSAQKNPSKTFESEYLALKIIAINKDLMHLHYRENSVRPNSPQQELLVFGNTDSNEKRSIATIASEILRPGDKNEVLNIYIEDVNICVAAQWKCTHEESLSRRSRHFKGLIADAIDQLPPHLPGIVHILYETTEGVDIESLRRQKHLEELSNFKIDNPMVLAVMLHGVNYYPTEGNYQWAETAQDFSRVRNFVNIMYEDPLMLGNNNTPSYTGTTHWDQDIESKR